MSAERARGLFDELLVGWTILDVSTRHEEADWPVEPGDYPIEPYHCSSDLLSVIASRGD